jgi:hypothetical protein
MLSHQYIIRLQMVEKTLSLRVYSDRSTEAGYLDIYGSFVPQLCCGGYPPTRKEIAANLRMARDFGYDIERVNL